MNQLVGLSFLINYFRRSKFFPAAYAKAIAVNVVYDWPYFIPNFNSFFY